MKKLTTLFALFLAALLLSGTASAATYTLIDEKYLPLDTINDPIKHTREPIVRYSFEELDDFLWNSPSFLRWNDGRRVCESMQIMFGQVSARCFNLPVKKIATLVPATFVAPQLTTATYRASTYQAPKTTYTSVVKTQKTYHTPRPKSSTTRSGVIVVDPVYPPYGPVYKPYAWV